VNEEAQAVVPQVEKQIRKSMRGAAEIDRPFKGTVDQGTPEADTTQPGPGRAALRGQLVVAKGPDAASVEELSGR
jgi:hypothetical protein